MNTPSNKIIVIPLGIFAALGSTVFMAWMFGLVGLIQIFCPIPALILGIH